MASKYPNASILCLITQTEGRNEKLIFLYLKPIPDFYNSDGIYWYDGAGKDGIPKNIWEKLSIKQWAACGKDTDIIQLFDTIFSSKKITIARKQIQLIIPPYKFNLYTDDPLRNRQGTTFDSFVTENNVLIPIEFYQKENLEFISGYKTSSAEIKTLFPLGFFEDGFIHKHLKKNTWGIKEHRTAYLTFHGVRESSNKGIGSKELVGFYQQNFNPSSDYIALVRNEANAEIGKAAIDKHTGFFKINLSEPTQKGKVEVLINNKEEKAIEYILIQDIKFDAHLANATFKDAYGRNFMITSDKKERPKSISNFTWQQNVYADAMKANQKLSDLFKTILDYLGPNILIADPYWFGNINQDKVTKALSLSQCQIAFINALIHSAIEKGIIQLNFLGCARATNHLDNDDTGKLTKIELLVEHYEKIFRDLITASKIERYLHSGTVVFTRANKNFHNRYWFSLTNKEGVEVLDKCVIITNSINNLSEVDILSVSDESQLRQIIRKYTGIFKNSKIRFPIEWKN